MTFPVELSIMLDNIEMEIYNALNDPFKIYRTGQVRTIRTIMEQYYFTLLSDRGSYRVVFTHETYPGYVFKVALNEEYDKCNKEEADVWYKASPMQRAYLVRHYYLSRSNWITVLERIDTTLREIKEQIDHPYGQLDEFTAIVNTAWGGAAPFRRDLHLDNVGLDFNGKLKVIDYAPFF